MASTAKINPALQGLGLLVGDWEMEVKNARFLPDPTASLRGTAGFEWTEGGDFLIMRQGTKKKGPPYSTSIIGRDESDEEYTMLYLDDRGVSRVYKMSLEGDVLRQWRDAPDFHQRFSGRLSKDGNTIEASWEMSEDGRSWRHDFDLTYRRKRNGR